MHIVGNNGRLRATTLGLLIIVADKSQILEERSASP